MNHQLPTNFQQFIHMSRYARWVEGEQRRETWEETVDRYLGFMCDVQCRGKIPEDLRQELREAILNLEVMPSMRCMMTAGPALTQNFIAAYNCCAIAIDHPNAFDEMLLVLMNGCGCGFSVERQMIANLPVVAERIKPTNTTIVVEDSKEGWAVALRELISCLYSGSIPKWDLTKIRPAGAKLKTFGGRASGPDPLDELFRFAVDIFKGSVGRRLNSLECHDLCCHIAECVVVGGVRRSATLSLSNLSDDRMRHAKSGDWWVTAPFRAMANNSIAFTEKPDMGSFMREWTSLYESKAGERGLVNRNALKRQAVKYGRRDPNYDFLLNPCGETILRSGGVCNLTEVIVRETDTDITLKRKVKLATILGTMQATFTDFKYLRDMWKKNAEEEALLGVSLTGIFDNKILSGAEGKRKLAEMLNGLREQAEKINEEWANKLGIKVSAAICLNKPSGTVSCLCDSASGIHPRYSEYYIRRVRCDKKDPLAQLMISEGFPCEDDATKPENQWVFSFPMKAPLGAVTGDNLSALEHLDVWRVYKEHWCHHNPSITVHVSEDEWMEVGAWVYKNFDIIGGVTFLPKSGHTYKQMPFEAITKEDYENLLKQMPKSIDWSNLRNFETDDTSITAHKEYACVGNACEIVDITSGN